KRKVEILADMLNTLEAANGNINDNDEAIQELYASVKSSQPIVTKIIEEDYDNEEEVNDLLALNDSINNVVTKYQLLRGGNIDEAKNIKVSGGGTTNATANLIDFDDDDTSAPISTDSKDQ